MNNLNRRSFLGPGIAGLVGLSLLVAGIMTLTGGDPSVGDAARASGALDDHTIPAVVVAAPTDTVANPSPDFDPTPTTAAAPIQGWAGWSVGLFTSFDDDVAWGYGTSGEITRDLNGDTYVVSRTGNARPVWVPTWQYGYKPPEDFLIAVDVVGSTGRAACGLALGGEDLPTMFAVVDSDAGSYRLVYFADQTSGEMLDSGSDPTSIVPQSTNRVVLLRSGTSLQFYVNDVLLADVVAPDLSGAEVGLALRVPEGADTSSCEYDNFEVRRP